MKKVFNLIIAAIIIATTALGNTAHAQDDRPVETGLVDFVTLKQREPRLLSPDEQTKLYPSLAVLPVGWQWQFQHQ